MIKPGHYNYIDFSRGVAILLVIMVHTGQHVSGFDGFLKKITSWGQMGVQLFFVASALTLCISWHSRGNERRKSLKFFIRRFFRIAPLYYLGIVFYFALSWVDSRYMEGYFARNFNYTPSRVMDNMFFLHGLSQRSNNNIVPGGWSIGAEFLFYFSFPIIMMASTVVFKRDGLLKISLCMFIISLGWFLYVSTRHGSYILNSYWYYNVLSQLPAFAFGMLLYITLYKINFKINSKLYCAMALLVVVSICIFNAQKNGALIWLNISIASSAFFMIILVVSKLNLRVSLIENIGVVSYSMYISHFVLVWFFVPVLSREIEGYVNGAISFCVMYLITVFAAYFISKMLYRYVESPFIKAGKNITKKIDSFTK
ncbi:acyltransferase [Cronobacter turicensis]|nr:acyltransferase [Cronobacter turicensis]